VNAGDVNNCGAVDATQTIIITDVPQVAVNFTGEGIPGNTEGCAPFELVIDNQTTPAAGVGFDWDIDNPGFDFVNNTNDNSRNPEITFLERGTFTLSLTASNECGAGDPWEQAFNIGSSPSVILEPIPDTCGDFTGTFSATIDGQGSTISQINWNFPGGTPATFSGEIPPAVSFTPSTEAYQVSVSAENECGTQTSSDSFFVSGLAALQLSNDTTICSSEGEITLQATPGGGIWSGEFIDRQTGVFSPPIEAEGDFTITYAVGTDQCRVEDSLTITVNALPQIALTPEVEALCEGDTPLTISATPVGGRWNNGSLTDTIFDPVTSGTYSLTYTYLDPGTGCENSETTEIEVQPKPVITVTDRTYCRTESDIILTDFSPGLDEGGGRFMGRSWNSRCHTRQV